MKINKIAPVYTSDFWYDLTMGGGIDIDKLVTESDDAKKIKDAIATVQEFQESLEKSLMIEYI